MGVMSARLREILAAEGITMADSALRLVSRESEGSMRDALSLLDRIISFCGTDADFERVASILGVADRAWLSRLVQAALDHDVASALTVVSEAFEYGIDLRQFTSDLVHYLRDVVVLRVAGQDGQGLTDLADEERAALASLGGDRNIEDLERLFRIVTRTAERLSQAAFPRLELEMAVIRMCRLRPLVPIDHMIERLGAIERHLESGAPLPPPQSPQTPTPRSPPSGGGGGGGGPMRGAAPVARAAAPRPVDAAPTQAAEPVLRLVREEAAQVSEVAEVAVAAPEPEPVPEQVAEVAEVAVPAPKPEPVPEPQPVAVEPADQAPIVEAPSVPVEPAPVVAEPAEPAVGPAAAAPEAQAPAMEAELPEVEQIDPLTIAACGPAPETFDQDAFEVFADKVREGNPMLAAQLDHSQVTGYRDGHVRFGFERGAQSADAAIEARNLIVALLREHVGEMTALEIELVDAVVDTPFVRREARRIAARAAQRQRIVDHPVVQSVIAQFDGALAGVDLYEPPEQGRGASGDS